MRAIFLGLILLSLTCAAEASGRKFTVVYKHITKNARTILTNSGGALPVIPASTLKMFTAWAAFVEGKRTDTYLAKMLQNSDNTMANNTTVRLGGVEGIRDTLLRDGVLLNETNYVTVDGSGLSKSNQVSCDAEIDLLEHIYDSSEYMRFRNLLAQPGHPGTDQKGTLLTRLLNYRGKIFAKTGTLRKTIALSGYAETKTGTLLFCLNSQDFTGTWDQERAIIDRALSTQLEALK